MLKCSAVHPNTVKFYGECGNAKIMDFGVACLILKCLEKDKTN